MPCKICMFGALATVCVCLSVQAPCAMLALLESTSLTMRHCRWHGTAVVLLQHMHDGQLHHEPCPWVAVFIRNDAAMRHHTIPGVAQLSEQEHHRCVLDASSCRDQRYLLQQPAAMQQCHQQAEKAHALMRVGQCHQLQLTHVATAGTVQNDHSTCPIDAVYTAVMAALEAMTWQPAMFPGCHTCTVGCTSCSVHGHTGCGAWAGLLQSHPHMLSAPQPCINTACKQQPSLSRVSTTTWGLLLAGAGNRGNIQAWANNITAMHCPHHPAAMT